MPCFNTLQAICLFIYERILVIVCLIISRNLNLCSCGMDLKMSLERLGNHPAL